MRIKFYFFSALYFFMIMADGLVTYIGTPDLSREANPLVSVFGLGWGALFLANALVFALCLLLFFHTFVRFKPSFVESQNFKQYYSMVYFKRPDKFAWTFYKLPNNKRGFSYLFAALGYSLAIVFPCDRFILVLQWIGHIYFNQNAVYLWYNKNIRSAVPLGRFDILVSLVLIVLLFFVWFWKAYKINKTTLE